MGIFNHPGTIMVPEDHINTKLIGRIFLCHKSVDNYTANLNHHLEVGVQCRTRPAQSDITDPVGIVGYMVLIHGRGML